MSKRRPPFELVLVIALPLAAVVAGIVTLLIAMQQPLRSEARLDRFGHLVQERARD